MSLSVSCSSISETSFSAKVHTSGSVAMQHNWYLDGSLYTTVQTAKGETSSSCSFRGLSPGTRYSVRVVVYALSPWKELDSGSSAATTQGSKRPPRPSNWYWRNVGSAGTAFNMPASEWNDFVTRIQDFAEYKGITLSSAILSGARASKGSQPLASQANAACMMIERLAPSVSVPYSVSSGDPITASFFDGLRNALNSVS